MSWNGFLLTLKLYYLGNFQRNRISQNWWSNKSKVNVSRWRFDRAGFSHLIRVKSGFIMFDYKKNRRSEDVHESVS